MNKRAKRVSPLHEPPLNNPGESLRERFHEILAEATAWLVACGLALGMAVWEWIRWYTHAPPSPVVLTAIAIGLIVVFVVWEFPRVVKSGRQADLGVEGEKHVAEVLDGLKADGYHVIHDIVEDGYNIDHVLIGPTGVYVIETKTRSKSDNRRDVHVTYDGLHVLVDGHAPDRDPLKQVQALADRVRKVLRGCTKLNSPIRPVVLYPGWFVEKQPKGVAIWVLSPKGLPYFVRNEPVRCDQRDVSMLVAAIEAHVRTASMQRV